MIASAKAAELINKYYEENDLLFESLTFIQAKECALITIDEILKSNPTIITCNTSELNYAYWVKVKKELNKL